MAKDSQQIIQQIAQALYDKKGANIMAIDVRDLGAMTDFFLFADGMASTHVQALKRAAEEALETFGWKPVHVEGLKNGDWIVLDYVAIVIHLFDPQVRDYYRVEEVWKEGKIVPLELQ